MNTTPVVKTLIDEQLDSIERTVALLGFGLPFNEVIGKPREMRVCDLHCHLAMTIRRGYIVVRVGER